MAIRKPREGGLGVVYLVDWLVAEEDRDVVWAYKDCGEGQLAVVDGTSLDVKARFEV
jgi:hypothetical protein